METTHFTDTEINHILTQYKNKRNREKKEYHEVKKNDPEWCKLNNERAKKHYHDNIEKKKSTYQTNKELVNARNMWRYYVNLNRHNDFITKHPDKVEYLKENGIDCKAPSEEDGNIFNMLLK
tara:strand:- start:482 stop:847 length:366 start_codon:yes stop_codon:yes gene_type:complete